jgi:predicted alpha/beta-fold hydrolase
MTFVENNSFTPPWYLFNKHFETIFPALLRKVENKAHQKERLYTPDKDFIDIDDYDFGKKRTVILCHGLEGNSNKPYMKGMVNTLIDNGFNCIAWNFRGCSGLPNNYSHSYHSGATQDLNLIIEYTIRKFPSNEIFLIGFSLGGNLVLKYLGERPKNSIIKKAVAISVPLDLHGSCKEISKTSNWIYTNRFLISLKKKIKEKARIFPKEINSNNLNRIRNLLDFDDKYTAPLHGFSNAIEYYTKCSSIHFLENISIPTLIINALNDPFLSEKCYPRNINNKYITYDYPKYGGHLGFKMKNSLDAYYHEIYSVKFLRS